MNRMNGCIQLVMVHLTANRKERRPADGGFPDALLKMARAYKYRTRGDDTRCTRPGFLPFSIASGKLIKGNDEQKHINGVPQPSLKRPVHLLLAIDTCNTPHRLAGHALLFPEFTGSSVVKLEYLCGAPRYRGVGKVLLSALASSRVFSPYTYERLILEDDSGVPGYYARRGFIRAHRSPKHLGSLSAFENNTEPGLSSVGSGGTKARQHRGASMTTRVLPPSRLRKSRDADIYVKNIRTPTDKRKRHALV
jgi:hypothetical protein